ncbi:hypothetical protein L1049_017673 [Liquidambar formosana]|uniref:Uncharacterized protein n=1 Tax=Liquidambar formosana TaxID=63359 RepID=A0AAP0S3U2_LIQFO
MKVKSSTPDRKGDAQERKESLRRGLKTYIWIAVCIVIVSLTMGLAVPDDCIQGIAMVIFNKELASRATTMACSCFAASILMYFWASRQRNYKDTLHVLRLSSTLSSFSLVSMVIASISKTTIMLAESPWLRTIYVASGCGCVFYVFYLISLIRKLEKQQE